MLGRAKTGKTNRIMHEIKERMSNGEDEILLIVPEQYSHYAERQLCEVCGDTLSLHAEVLSFTRLCNHVLAETGGAADQILDSTGQILAMYKALESVAQNLKVFNQKKMHTEVLEKLLEAVKEFKSLNIMPQTLQRAAQQIPNPLSDKLKDLSLIFDAYDAILHTHGGDAADRLTLLADKIGESSVGKRGHIYFDGFNDFTIQEICVIEELLLVGANITVSLTCDMKDTGEIFKLPSNTVSQLKDLAEEYGVELKQEVIKSDPSNKHPKSQEILTFLERHLFDDALQVYPGEGDNIRIYNAPNRYVECEYAAYEVWKLVKNGYRWRDIGVMARNWDEYDSICENVFDKYDIPYFSSGKSDIMSKPPLALIDAALEIAVSGWEYKHVFRYIKSGLAGISTDECAIMENYVLKWQIRGSMWTREWSLPPRGYGRQRDDDNEQLHILNKLRNKVVEPIMNLREGIKGESTIEGKLRAVYAYLEEVELQKRLITRAEELNKRGELRLADEYVQLLDIIIGAMDQMYVILGKDMIDALKFRKLFTMAISQNDVGTIPVSLDRTMLGGMAMSRRRDLKAVIILGATDDNLPTLSKATGALSDNERIVLNKIVAEIPAGLEERLCREMNMIYSTLTLPANELIIMHSTGDGQRPSFIVKRLCDMFSIGITGLDKEEYMTAAVTPYIELMWSNGSYDDKNPAIFDSLRHVLRSNEEKRQLSNQTASLLYGKEFSLSATGVDRYYSCQYKYFMENGLRLEPRAYAEFDALTAGNFMHYVLDGVFSEIKQSHNFDEIDEQGYLQLTRKYMNEYESNILLDFEGKNERFRHLFRRHRADVEHVVSDMVKEISNSSFVPLDFELNLSKLSTKERGLVDRVDGYEDDDKLYLRVVDYKTRKSAYTFEMNNILHGRDMQMLIYLFALAKYGKKFYGKEIEPAGVLYVPARDVILETTRDPSDDEIDKKRIDKMRRSGIILNDQDIVDAMEGGEVKKFLPVKTVKDGSIAGDSLVSKNQFTLLSQHVKSMMDNAKNNIVSGHNECNPYYANENNNACSYCEFHSVCGFDSSVEDKYRFVGKQSSEEVWTELENKYE